MYPASEVSTRAYSSRLNTLWMKMKECVETDHYKQVLSFLYVALERECYPLISEEKLYRPSIVSALQPLTLRENSLLLVSRHHPLERTPWMTKEGRSVAAIAALIESVEERGLAPYLYSYENATLRAQREGQCYNLCEDIELLRNMVWPVFRKSFERSCLAISKSSLGNEWKILLKQSFDLFFLIVLHYLTGALVDDRASVRQLGSLIRCFEHSFILGHKKGDPSTWIVLVD